MGSGPSTWRCPARAPAKQLCRSAQISVNPAQLVGQGFGAPGPHPGSMDLHWSCPSCRSPWQERFQQSPSLKQTRGARGMLAVGSCRSMSSPFAALQRCPRQILGFRLSMGCDCEVWHSDFPDLSEAFAVNPSRAHGRVQCACANRKAVRRSLRAMKAAARRCVSDLRSRFQSISRKLTANSEWA